jgi:hypothetical protein
MSITISNCNEICSSPTNTSKAKMLYTFSKGERFSKRKIIMYNLTNLGVISFMKLNKIPQSEQRHSGLDINMTSLKSKNFNNISVPKSPPPNVYSIKSDFDLDKKKGFGFGQSRD